MTSEQSPDGRGIGIGRGSRGQRAMAKDEGKERGGREDGTTPNIAVVIFDSFRNCR